MSRFFFVLWVVISILIVITMMLPYPAPSAFGRGQVDIIAHQGGNLDWPDATVLAYDEAAALGVDVLEMDVHLSKDGRVIVLHDETVDRTTDGQGAIRDLTLAQLKQLDAAYWWPYHPNDDVEKANVPADFNFPFRGLGEQILTLREMFERYPNDRFVIELKDGTDSLREATLELMREFNRWDNTMLASVYADSLQAIRKAEPAAQTYGAESEIRLFYILHLFRLERFYPYDIQGFAIPTEQGSINLATAKFIRAAQNAGILLHYWTINDDETMQLLLDANVDGIMTDRPIRLKALRDNGE